MEQLETVEVINERLKQYFGIDSEGTAAIFRVVWSEDQFEKRLTNHTAEGFQLLYPEIRELPKYKQWIHNKYIFERLVIVPVVNEKELTTAKSYEPLWVFQDAHGNALPPKWEACKYIVDCIYAAMGKSSMAKYVDEEAKNPIEKQAQRIAKIEEELFGDESNFLGRTITGEAIAMPQEYGEIAQRDSIIKEK